MKIKILGHEFDPATTTVTLDTPCQTCHGTGHDGRHVAQYCRACGRGFTEAELAAENAAWDAWVNGPRDQRGYLLAEAPTQPCGHDFSQRMENDLCGDCDGNGKVAVRVMLHELIATLNRSQRGK